MPLYLFKNPKTNKVISVLQAMSEEHTYTENGIKHERVFTIPNASIDSQIDPNSSQQFVEKTGKMKGTLGEIWDYSKEMSEKRSRVTGVDPVREKAEAAYSKKRRGMKHKERINASEMPKIQFD
jgi:hypothetical protein